MKKVLSGGNLSCVRVCSAPITKKLGHHPGSPWDRADGQCGSFFSVCSSEGRGVRLVDSEQLAPVPPPPFCPGAAPYPLVRFLCRRCPWAGFSRNRLAGVGWL